MIRLLAISLGVLDPAIPDDAADTSWLRDITVAQVIGLLVLIAGVWLVVHRVVRAFRPVRDFLDDWNGETQRPGVPPKPGVMARLSAIEAHLTDAPTRREMDDVKHEIVQLKVDLARLAPSPLGSAVVTVDPDK